VNGGLVSGLVDAPDCSDNMTSAIAVGLTWNYSVIVVLLRQPCSKEREDGRSKLHHILVSGTFLVAVLTRRFCQFEISSPRLAELGI